MRILVVEDDDKTRRLLLRGLIESGFEADGCPDGEDGLARASVPGYDLVLLDVMMPKRDGFSVLMEMRARNIDTPVILLTAREGLADRVSGLDTGADDYLVKPVSFVELIARVNSVARRCLPEDDRDLSHDGLLLRAGERSVWCEDRELQLGEQEYRALRVLMQFAGEGLSLRFLAERTLLDGETESSLNDVIDGLQRRVDGSFARKFIHSVEGVGYLLK